MWLGMLLVLLVGICWCFSGIFISKLKSSSLYCNTCRNVSTPRRNIGNPSGTFHFPFPASFQYIASGHVLEKVKIGNYNVFDLLCGIVACAALIFTQVREWKKNKNMDLRQ